jgi:hypothetical protein
MNLLHLLICFCYKSENVRIVPYINGRIFDRNVLSWQTENASLYTAKSHPKTLYDRSASQNLISEYEEAYGSGAQFSVMCPSTNYWQTKIAGKNITPHAFFIKIFFRNHHDNCTQLFCRWRLHRSNWYVLCWGLSQNVLFTPTSGCEP